MNTNSNDFGRAYECAWINSLYQALSNIRTTRITQDPNLEANKRALAAMDKEKQNLLKRSADSAVSAILELEPLLCEDEDDELLLEFQPDDAGIRGDVRDIIIKRNAIKWEIGLSIKHNHEAIKHSRLSRDLDFGKNWFRIPCTAQYWADVKPIFSRLSAERSKGKKWSELPDKGDNVYIPLLKAFMEEIKRAYHTDRSMPEKMIEYLIGTDDYYKVVSHDKNRMTSVQGFNLHNTLNRPGKTKTSSIQVPVVKLPTELKDIRLKKDSNNKVEMFLNHGWELSFRIHNASNRVEPSLKFDVQFIKTPESIYRAEYKWN